MGHSDRNQNATMPTTEKTVKSMSKKVQGTMRILSGTGLEAILNAGKDLTTFCPCPENLNGTELIISELTSSVERMSRIHTTSAVV